MCFNLYISRNNFAAGIILVIVGLLLFVGATLLSWCLYQKHKADEWHRGFNNDLAVIEKLHQLRRL